MIVQIPIGQLLTLLICAQFILLLAIAGIVAYLLKRAQNVVDAAWNWFKK